MQKIINPITTRCKNCNLPIFQKGKRSMSPCPQCGVKWGFNTYTGEDKKLHIELWINGRPKQAAEFKKKKRSVSLSDHQMRKMEMAGYTPNILIQEAYNRRILGIDTGTDK